MGFMMTTAIMVTAAVYLWKRWRNTQGTKTSITLFTLVLLYPIIASGSLEHIWLGYLVTLLLTAPIPTLMFINWGHQKLEPTRRNTSRHQEHLQQYLRPARPEQKSATTLTNHTTGGLCRHPKHHQEVN